MEALEKYPCPDCGKLHGDSYDASKCCEDKIERVYVCPFCFVEDDDGDYKDVEQFWSHKDADAHIKTCLANQNVETDEETELNAIRDGVPTVDRWWAKQAEKTVTADERENLKIRGLSIV